MKTVKDLIEELKQCDPDAVVVQSSDGEGNSYSPFSDFWVGSYLAETTWSGEVGFLELTDELREQGEETARQGQGSSLPARRDPL